MKNEETMFRFIMASDPQYPWRSTSDGKEARYKDDKGNEKSAKYYAKKHVESMLNAFKKFEKIEGIMFNGDIVAFNNYEFFDDTHIEYFNKLYLNPLRKKAPVYIGLGNHDYENNVGRTAEERGPTQMVCFAHDNIKDQREQIGDEMRGSQMLEVPDYDGILQTGLKGSFAYSFDIYNIHFIQLNNYPTYENKWSYYNSEKARYYAVNIISSMNWLKRDLAKARNNGKAIIVCMHYDPSNYQKKDPTGHDNFIKLLIRYQVSALFVGHIHGRVGYGGDLRPCNSVKCDCKIPFFYCGSTSQGLYNILHFYKVVEKDNHTNKENKIYYMDVESESSLDGKVTKLKLHTKVKLFMDKGNYNLKSKEYIPERYIVCYNNGGYTAIFYLSYTNKERRKVKLDSGNKPRKSKHIFILPAGATDVEIKGKCVGGHTIFKRTKTNCIYETYGTWLLEKYKVYDDYDVDWHD